MKNFKAQIEAFAKSEGINLIGFADRARFADVDPQHNPFSHLTCEMHALYNSKSY